MKLIEKIGDLVTRIWRFIALRFRSPPPVPAGAICCQCGFRPAQHSTRLSGFTCSKCKHLLS